MKCIPTAIPEVLIIAPQVFGDERGFFFESFNRRQFTKMIGRNAGFVQEPLPPLPGQATPGSRKPEKGLPMFCNGPL
jgi:hypothetical protein